MKLLFPIFLFLSINIQIISQIIDKPNFSSASHPMTIDKIEFTQNQTIISLSIQNQSETGYFCADKNILMADPIKNKKYKLIESKGIPICPDSYKFKFVGEVLKFQLFFPKINVETKYINLIEECKENCFSIQGIILDKDFNREINLGYDNYSKGNFDLALAVFKQSFNNHVDYPFGILYLNIIQILSEKNDYPNAKIWYNKLINSKLLDKNEVINLLKNQSFYSKLIN